MPDDGNVDDRFRHATRALDERPIRWARVARARRRYRLTAVLATLTLALGLATVTLFGKAAVDPDFTVPIFEANVSQPSDSGVPRQQRLGDYRRELGLPTADLSHSQRRELGLVFDVRVHVKGTTYRRFTVSWAMYDARSGSPLRARRYHQTALGLRAEEAHDGQTLPLWVPYPPRPGRYFLRYRLEDEPTGIAVDISDTQTFTLRRIPPLH